MHRHHGRGRSLATIILSLVVATVSTTARADTVSSWNAIASDAIVATAGQSPHASAISFAMVQGAVYDAVNSIDRRRQPYLELAPAEPSASKQAAAATAAFRVLQALFPSQQTTLQPLYEQTLAPVPDGTAKDDGIAAGVRAADAMLAARANDGRGGAFTYTFGSVPGAWRPTPPTFGLDPAPWVGNVRPFLFATASELSSEGPNPLASTAYAEDFDEVRWLGSLNSTRRTPAQTHVAIFWQDNAISQWNRVFRALAAERDLGIADSARLFAMENLAAADGVIGCWHDKYRWNFWRPITAIRAGASDGNPQTDGDPTWTPLFDPSTPQFGPPLVTPGFPEHPSGHGCGSGAILHTAQHFFGTDKLAFSVFSNRTRTTRTFERFSDALKEIIDARVWGGIHFRTADVQGAVLGKRVARRLANRYFQPTD